MHCGERLTPAQLLIGDGQCPVCRDDPPEFERAVAFGEYEFGLRDLIHLLKYDSVLPAASALGGYLAEAIGEVLPSCKGVRPLVVPVPLHISKRKARGFNQADLIARQAAKRLPGNVEVASNVLERQRPTRSQVGLDREERIANLRGAFRVIAPEAVKGRTVIVVDDVMTTGATVSECARVLKQAGAERVLAATVARALKVAVTPEFANRGEEEANEAVEVAVSV